MKQRFYLTALCALVFAGCAITKTVTVSTEPPGATATLSDGFSEKTPFSRKLTFESHDKPIAVGFAKDGFKGTNIAIYSKPPALTNYHVKLNRETIVSLELVSYEPVSTPLGVKLKLVSSISRAYLETIERSANVAAVTKVTDNQDPRIYIGALCLSPAADNLVYCLFYKDGDSYISNLEKVAIGSFAKTKVTTGRFFDYFPAFAPDGKTLVFSSNRTGETPILWRVRIDGAGGIERLTNTQAEDFAPSASPDGKLIVYSSDLPAADEPQVWIIPANGGLSTQLREGYWDQVSPDGKSILYVRSDKRASQEQKRPIRQIWRMNIDGTGETRLTQDLRYDMIHPRWSPDGTHIVYASDEGRDLEGQINYDIWMMNADGSAPTQLTTNGSRDDSPCFDREGKKIYFRSNRGGNWNVWSFEPAIDIKLTKSEKQ